MNNPVFTARLHGIPGSVEILVRYDPEHTPSDVVAADALIRSCVAATGLATADVTYGIHVTALRKRMEERAKRKRWISYALSAPSLHNGRSEAERVMLCDALATVFTDTPIAFDPIDLIDWIASEVRGTGGRPYAFGRSDTGIYRLADPEADAAMLRLARALILEGSLSRGTIARHFLVRPDLQRRLTGIGR